MRMVEESDIPKGALRLVSTLGCPETKGIFKRLNIGKEQSFWLRGIAKTWRKYARDIGLVRDGASISEEDLKGPEFSYYIVGKTMELEAKMLEAVRLEMEESKKAIEDLTNQVKALSAIVTPALTDLIKSVRNNRMSITSEFREILKTGKEVREFFSGQEFKQERQRMEEFTRACQEFQKLKEDGALDILIDAALRLAERE